MEEAGDDTNLFMSFRFNQCKEKMYCTATNKKEHNKEILLLVLLAKLSYLVIF